MMARLVEVHSTLRPDAGSALDGTFRPGDIAVLTIAATPEGGRIAWPTAEELGQALGQAAAVLSEAEVVDGTPLLAAPSAASEARAWRIQLLLAPGERELPAVPLNVVAPDGVAAPDGAEDGGTNEAPAVSVTLASVLDGEVAAELDARAASEDPAALREAVGEQLAPARGPWQLAPTFPLAWLLAILAALVLAAILFAWMRRRARRPRQARPFVLEAAEVVARRRLAALRTSGLLARGEFLAFATELAETLKEYLERRTGQDLKERTTDEIRRLLAPPRGQGLVPLVTDAQSRSDVLDVLRGTDLVKFARLAPDPAEAFAWIDAAERVVERSTPRLEEPAAETPAQEAAA